MKTLGLDIGGGKQKENSQKEGSEGIGRNLI